RTAGGEPVEPVGQVHARGRAGDDEVDEDGIEDPEVDLRIDDPQPQRVLQAGALRRGQPQADRDRDRRQQLRATAQAERAAPHDLRVVVGEADRRARDRRAEDADRLPVVVREDQERQRDGGEDDQAAHRRRSRLRVMALRPLLADVLPELALADERDELRAQEDADEQRGGPRDQHAPHQRAASSAAAVAPSSAASAATTTSRPTPREAFTSTVSPARTSFGTSVAACAASARTCSSRASPNASAIPRLRGPTATSRSTPLAAACPPISAWKRASSDPSSSMSPSTATLRPSPAVAARSSRAARMDIGLAL